MRGFDRNILCLLRRTTRARARGLRAGEGGCSESRAGVGVSVSSMWGHSIPWARLDELGFGLCRCAAGAESHDWGCCKRCQPAH